MITIGSDRSRRRSAGLMLLRTVATAVVLVALYFLLPLDAGIHDATFVLLIAGSVGVFALVGIESVAIYRSDLPRLRAAEALVTSLLLYLLLFAAAYYLMERNTTTSFTEPMTRMDALYFTVSTFGTVGFGDIAAHSESARAAVMIQILGDLTFLGLGVKLLAGAAQRKVHQGSAGSGSSAES